MSSPYYAVFSGRAPGVYDNLDTCIGLTSGYKGALFKAYASYEDALRAYNAVSAPSEADTSGDEVALYCDGSYRLSSSGFGLVEFRDYSLHNAWYGHEPEADSSTDAELRALRRALVRAKKLTKQGKLVKIYSDALPCLERIESLADKSRLDFQKELNKSNDALSRLYYFCVKIFKQIKSSVQLCYVKAHSNYLGNELADKLAKVARKNDFTFDQYHPLKIKSLIV